MTCYKLGRQARSLGEAADDNPIRGYSRVVRCFDNRLHFAKRGGEPWFVLSNRREKRIRVPAISGGLRSKIGELREINTLGQREDILGRTAAAVQKNHSSGRI